MDSRKNFCMDINLCTYIVDEEHKEISIKEVYGCCRLENYT